MPAPSFQQHIAQLMALVAAGRDPNVSASSEEYAVLGKWLAHQRKAFRSGKLAASRLAQLRSVAGLRGFQ